MEGWSGIPEPKQALCVVVPVLGNTHIIEVHFPLAKCIIIIPLTAETKYICHDPTHKRLMMLPFLKCFLLTPLGPVVMYEHMKI